MAIATDTQASGAPFAKFAEIGQQLVGAFASDPGKSRRQMRNFESKAPLFRDDGKPRLEEIMHFVAMPGTTAGTGELEALHPIEPGAHVRFSVSGWKWGQVIEARKQLPAYNGVEAGKPASGDVYTITLVGFSAETKNPAAAEAAGFTVVDGRIILRTQDEKDRYVLAQSKKGGNTNPAKDFEITIRRPRPDEKPWEQAADELYLTKPWEHVPATDAGDDPFPASDAAGIEEDF